MQRRGKCSFVVGFSVSRLVGSSLVIWSEPEERFSAHC